MMLKRVKLSRKKVLIGLIFASLMQGCILVGEYVVAGLPLWTGKEIRIKTVPVDPRSLFRGQYVRLNYEFSRIDMTDIETEYDLRNGEIVYVSMKEKDGVYEYAGASLLKPESGVFLRGRIANKRYEEQAGYYRMKYGLEAYFLPKEAALETEISLRDGGVATVKVSDSGRARIVDVL